MRKNNLTTKTRATSSIKIVDLNCPKVGKFLCRMRVQAPTQILVVVVAVQPAARSPSGHRSMELSFACGGSLTVYPMPSHPRCTPAVLALVLLAAKSSIVRLGSDTLGTTATPVDGA
jgi:hypothetical protein